MAKNEKKVEEKEEVNTGFEADTTTGKKDAAENGEKKIEVSETLLRELIAQNKDLTTKVDILTSNAAANSSFNNSPNNLMMVRKNKDTFLKLRKWNDKFVLGYENKGTEKRPLYVYNEYNVNTRENVQFCNIILEGEETPIKLEYVTFRRDAETIFVKKVSQKEDEKVTVQGYVHKKDFNDSGYGMFETMVQVPVEVIEKVYTYTVETEDGRQFDIEGQFIG